MQQPMAEHFQTQGAEGAAEPAGAATSGAVGAPELPAWVPEPLVRLWDLIQSYPLLGAALIVAAFWLAAKLAEFLLVRGVARFAGRTRTEVDDRLIQLLHRPVFITVFFWGLALAVRSLDLSPGMTEITVRVLQTLAVLVWVGAGFRISHLGLEALGRNRERFRVIEERTLPLFDIISKVLLIGGGGYVLLLIWNLDPTGWLASAGVIGIAVGFAAKDTLANLFAGFFILADAPYKLGDFVVLDSGERGRVTHVGIRSTRLLTRDDIEITVPNSVIANAKIVNESGGPWEKERIRIKVGVAYGTDVDEVCRLLEEVAREHDHVCPDPPPRVRFRTFGDSSLDFELLCWIDEPVLRGRLIHELNMEVYKAFARAGIEIPYPKRDLYVRQLPAAAPKPATSDG